MDQIVQDLMDQVPDVSADVLMVQMAGTAMLRKLKQKRGEGRGGWHTSRATSEELRQMLLEHVGKGDPVDVMNFAGMLHMREHLYGERCAGAIAVEPRQLGHLGAKPGPFIKLDMTGKQVSDSAESWATVYDCQTGLIYPAELPEQELAWTAVPEAVKHYSCGGFSGWRWAHRRETLQIIDETKYSPAIDTRYFRYPKSGWVWTNSSLASDQDSDAWYVALSFGYAFYGYLSLKGLWLPVCGPVARPGQ